MMRFLVYARNFSKAIMSDRHFPNQYPDYDARLDVNQDGGYSVFRPTLESQCHRLLAMLEDGIRMTGDAGDETVYTGVGGHALLFSFLSRIYPSTKDMSDKAVYYTNRSLQLCGSNRPTFLCGDIGPYAIHAVLTNSLGDPSAAERVIQSKILNILQSVTNQRSKVPSEILYGRAGYLYSLLWLRQEIPSSSTIITDSHVRQVVTSIIQAGQQTRADMRGTGHPPLFYFWHDSPYVGAAHGFYGILYVLLLCRRLLSPEELNLLIRPTLDYLLDIRFPSGNTPSSVGREHDKLVHWCHGAPGVVYTLTEAFKVFGDPKYLEAARRSAEVIWARGLLKKGYGICHGVAGNAYAFLHLYKVTGENVYLHRAIKFSEFIFDYGKHGCRIPDTPYSLFEGMAGTVYFLFDLLNNPRTARFPAYELENEV